MKKCAALLFAICVFGFPYAARAQKTTMYKLGQVYASDEDDSVKCLESHTGFILQHKECRDIAAGKCKSDAQCQEQNGGSKNYYCSKKTKTCQYQECYLPETSRVSCAKTYSDMYSCVDNENMDGGHYCDVTCTWNTVTSELDQDDLNALTFRLKLDMEAWKKPSQALSFYKALNFDKNNPHANNIKWDKLSLLKTTCRTGKTGNCWVGSYCMGCSMLTGGTDGIVGNGDAGTYPSYYGTDAQFVTYGSSDTNVNKMPNKTAVHLCFSIENYISMPMILDLNGLDAENVLTSNFETVANTQQSLFANTYKELAPLLKVPEFYSLGPTPICSYYYTKRTDLLKFILINDEKMTVSPGTTRPSETAFMIYLPAQEAVSARQLMDGSREPWDLRDRDRIACCSLSTYKSKLSGGQAMKCVELDASNPDVVDMAD